MKFEMKKKLVAKSERVKSVDLHPQFPWVLIGLYSGNINIYDYNTQASLHYIEVTQFPIRCAKFISERNMFVCGADDLKVRLFNYNTMEKIKEVEVHSDFLRSLLVHPTEPIIITSSDDCTIKLWDYEKNFNLIRSLEEHKNFVMKVALNPKDPSMFASGSMDKKIKCWSINSSNSHITLEGHSQGVNSVAFCPLNDKPYLASGADDRTIKIWDYTTKHCVFTLEGHEENVTTVAFHPELPLIISGSEDTCVKFWNANTFKIEDSKIYSLDKIWDIATLKEHGFIALGCEEGTVVLKLGSDSPLAIFNLASAKIIFSKQTTICSLNLKTLPEEIKDGEIINLPPKNLGTADLFPLSLKFSQNGRNFAILSEKEYVISTSGVYRNTSFGNGTDLAWADNGDFAVKDSTYIRIYKNFQEFKSFKPGFNFDAIYGGPYLAIKTLEAIYLYDYETQIFIRKIDTSPTQVIWNEKSNLLCLICEDITYVLKVFPQKITNYLEIYESNSKKDDEEGCEEGFEIYNEINDKIISGLFIDDVFIFINSKNKVNYIINTQIFPITTLEKNFYLMGYLSNLNRIFLISKNFELISYTFPQSFVNYQIAILQNNFKEADKIYNTIPIEYNERITKFLEKFNFFEKSFEVTRNKDHKFLLSIKLKLINKAYEFACEYNTTDKWKMVADLALEQGDFLIAEEAMMKSKDYNSLLFYYTCISNREKLELLASRAEEDGLTNCAFAAYFEINNVDKCLELLIKTQKFSEASLFCRTYAPSKISGVIEMWNNEINKTNSRINTVILNPLDKQENQYVLEIEKNINSFYEITKSVPMEKQKICSEFIDFDLEKYMAENDSSEIDLTKLLDV